jgi:hypothetical protein
MEYNLKEFENWSEGSTFEKRVLAKKLSFNVCKGEVNGVERVNTLFEKLSKDSDWQTLQYLVQNHDCPTEILTNIDRDADKYLKMSIINNPKASFETVKDIMEEVFAENPFKAISNFRNVSEERKKEVLEIVVDRTATEIDDGLDADALMQESSSVIIAHLSSYIKDVEAGHLKFGYKVNNFENNKVYAEMA